jgi:hypothetical protein
MPGNVHLALSEAPLTGTFDPNNKGAIIALVTGFAPGGTAVRLLMPGDCSYYYVPGAMKENLTHLLATHHGSTLSILTRAGRSGGTFGDNDIPQGPVTGGVVIYSYGFENRYHITAENSGPLYEQKNWTIQTTLYNSRNGEIDVALSTSLNSCP